MFGGISWFINLPELAKAVLFASSVINVLIILLVAMAFILFAMIYFGPYKNPH